MSGLEVPERYNVAADLLQRNLKAGRGKKVAIHHAGGEVTYDELHRLAAGAGRALLDHGVRREERVLIAAFDSPGWVASSARCRCRSTRCCSGPRTTTTSSRIRSRA